MRNDREVILFLNIIRFNNKRIIELIESGKINLLIDLKIKNINNMTFLTNVEKETIKSKLINYNTEYELHKLSKYNIKFSTFLDKNYPERLKNIFNPPALLYYKGIGFENLDKVLAIVGTRKPTSYGIWVTKKIISELSIFNIKIVSGMALGIDYYAHNESINFNIQTIGILASSLEIEYPKSNFNLYRKMQKELLISEFPLGTQPIKRNFVQRNRIISALSFGTLVIEAAERSGSLITANFALEQNREVYAVPGNINNAYSVGCNNLIKNGAKIVQSAKDIIEEIEFILNVNNIENTEIKYNLDSNEKIIYSLLKKGNLTVDEIVKLSSIDISNVYKILTKLEIKYLISKNGSRFMLNK